MKKREEEEGGRRENEEVGRTETERRQRRDNWDLYV